MIFIWNMICALELVGFQFACADFFGLGLITCIKVVPMLAARSLGLICQNCQMIYALRLHLDVKV